MELGGIEPPTFSMRRRRATNCAIAPCASAHKWRLYNAIAEYANPPRRGGRAERGRNGGEVRGERRREAGGGVEGKEEWRGEVEGKERAGERRAEGGRREERRAEEEGREEEECGEVGES